MLETTADLAKEMGRALTEEISPAELPFFDELVAAQDVPTRRTRDHTLAFGIPIGELGLAAILAAVGKVILEGLWTATKPMLAGLATDAANELRGALSTKIAAWIKARFKIAPPIELSADAIQAIIAAAKSEASSRGVTEPQLGQLETTLVAAFAPKVS